MDRGEGIIELPDDCSFERKGHKVRIEGPKGTNERKLFNRKVTITENDGTITIEHDKTGKKSKRVVNALTSHIENMIKGVTEGITYRLQICSGHFPMSVDMQGDTLKVENFIGEKVPRTLDIEEGVDVSVQGEEILVESTDKEKAGRVASSIEELTKRNGFDKRIFQDGLYIIEKDGKELI